MGVPSQSRNTTAVGQWGVVIAAVVPVAQGLDRFSKTCTSYSLRS